MTDKTDNRWARTVTVRGGPYATIRAIEKARREYGDDTLTVTGLLEIRDTGLGGPGLYTYSVVNWRTP